MRFFYTILPLATTVFTLTAAAPMPDATQQAETLIQTRHESELHARGFKHWFHCHFGSPTGAEYVAPC